MMQIRQHLIRQPILSAYKFIDQSINRTIYTAEQLSIDKYEQDRRRLIVSLQPDSRKLKRTHIQRLLRQKHIQSHIMLTDLTQFMHLIEDTESDFLLLHNALKKLSVAEVENYRRNSIGSILMRMLHYFRKDEIAINFYNDVTLQQKFLSGKHCQLLFFDLLYKQKRYAEFLQHFQGLRERLESKQQTITRTIYVLVFATCYNQNTPESFKYAMELENQYRDAHITQEHLTFLSALALNQSAPHVAEKLLLALWPISHISIPSLRLIAYIQMHKFIDALQLFRSILVVFDYNRSPKTEVFSNEAIDEAEKMFNTFLQDERLRSDFHQLRNNLQTHGYIVNKKLKTMILEPFNVIKLSNRQQNRMFLQAEFNRRNT